MAGSSTAMTGGADWVDVAGGAGGAGGAGWGAVGWGADGVHARRDALAVRGPQSPPAARNPPTPRSIAVTWRGRNPVGSVRPQAWAMISTSSRTRRA